MKKTVSINIVLSVILCIGLIFSGSVVAEEITTVGTRSCSPVLNATGAPLSQNNPGAIVSVPKSIETGGEIKASGIDKNMIALIDREIKDKEKHYGLTYVPCAKNPIVNKSAGITNYSNKQSTDIYSSKVAKRKDISGKDIRMELIRRKDVDSSSEVQFLYLRYCPD